MDFIIEAFQNGGNYGWAWAAWLLQFFVIEFPALNNKRDGDTLSEVLRYIFGFSKRAHGFEGEQAQSWGMRLRRLSFYAFSAWFVPHIATDWW